MTYKIEDGVPMPRRGRQGKLTELSDTIAALKVGQSFVWTTSEMDMNSRSAQARIHERASVLGIRVTSRSVEGGYRIWRIE